ncbi:MAG: histidinol-phosphatase [Deltaproteobacteria bacterium]|nr:MAG: histidinol-phosphatase [Deltaproteobacteria bacterium]
MRRAGHLALDAAGQVLRRAFRTDLRIDDKGGPGAYDPVTEADRAAEQAIRAVLRRETPDIGIFGEEQGHEGPAEGAGTGLWIVDPIDGTRSFMSGFPTWGTLLGLRRGAAMVWGAMDQPVLGERFEGDGRTSRLGNRPLRARPCSKLDDAVLYATTPDMFDEPSWRAFDTLAGRVRLRRFGGDCYAYAMLAFGCIDLVVEAGLSPYDIAPLVPILEGAGATVTTWTGGPAHEGGRIVAAATAELHAAACEVLASAGT